MPWVFAIIQLPFHGDSLAVEAVSDTVYGAALP
jgi:hypothetical protein